MTNLKTIFVLLGLSCLLSCSTGYDNNGNSVTYKTCNEANGCHTYTIDADPKSFIIFKNDIYAKDNKKAFYQGQEIKNVDAKSFEVINDYYTKDANMGYFCGRQILNSDGKTFKVINDYYSTDGKDVFFEDTALKVENPKNFKFVFDKGENERERWTTDGVNYFYLNFKVPSDDYLNMTLYKNSGGLSKDRNWVYFLDHKLNFDIEGKKVVDTIDVASFQVTGFITCKDKFGCFNVYHGRQECEK